jgi:hypothetical protein
VDKLVRVVVPPLGVQQHTFHLSQLSSEAGLALPPLGVQQGGLGVLRTPSTFGGQG